MGVFLAHVAADLAFDDDAEILRRRMTGRIDKIVRHHAACAILAWIDEGRWQFKIQLSQSFAYSHALFCIGISESGTGVTRQGRPRVSADPVTGSHGPS